MPANGFRGSDFKSLLNEVQLTIPHVMAGTKLSSEVTLACFTTMASAFKPFAHELANGLKSAGVDFLQPATIVL